jgi:hypothetical protein
MSNPEANPTSKELIEMLDKMKSRLYQLFVFPVEDDWDVAWNTALGSFCCEFYKIAAGSTTIGTAMDWIVKQTLKCPTCGYIHNNASKPPAKKVKP